MTNYKMSDSKSSCGYWECPECKSQFDGGGYALHKKSCSRNGYDGLTYFYTQAEVDLWNRNVEREGFAAHMPLSPSGLSDYLLKEAIASNRFSPDQIRQITISYVESVNAKYLPKTLEILEELLDSI